MVVVYWQMIVVASVLITYIASGQRTAFWVSIAWTAWTLAALVFLPLVLIQLLSAWGTYIVCKSFARSGTSAADARSADKDFQRRVAKAREEIFEEARRMQNEQIKEILQKSNLPRKTRSAVKGIAKETPSRVAIVAGDDHFELLLKTLREARSTLCILSGWIGSPLLDQDIQRALRDALERGVNVYIGYGWESSSGRHEMSSTAVEARRFLDRLCAEERGVGELRVAQVPSHEKVLARDNQLLVIGSNNWLSNRTFRNTERSMLIESGPLATLECQRIIDLVTANQQQ